MCVYMYTCIKEEEDVFPKILLICIRLQWLKKTYESKGDVFTILYATEYNVQCFDLKKKKKEDTGGQMGTTKYTDLP